MNGSQRQYIKLEDLPRHQSVGVSRGTANLSYDKSPSQEVGEGGKSEEPTRGYHRDILRRKFIGEDLNEKFLNPYDGRLCDLVVQSSQDVERSDSRATWYRTGLKNGSSWTIRASNWAMSRDHGPEAPVGTDVATAFMRWIPACLALSVITFLPIQVAATPSNFGRYEPFLYKDWRYPLDARNKSENRDATNVLRKDPHVQAVGRPVIGKRERLVEPDYLCFVKADGKVVQSKVSDWIEEKGRMTPTDYVFISYTAQHFPDERSNNEYLRSVGVHAARTVGVNAYWISTSCLYNLEEKDKNRQEKEKENSVWNMSDIIRRARAVAIAVPGPLDGQYNGDSLKEWGTRVWTMPELLLYTGSHSILVYESVKRLDERRLIPRRELWNRVWSDTVCSGHLIDHYEGSLHLTPLELNTTALYCLQNRYTTEFLPSDLACVLMGLLRQRPQIVRTETEFQAFARLSLANDSNMLFERMICLLPESLDADWWSLDDSWNATLWDIYPKTQICGIGNGDTVILDGARAAAIRWDEFVPVLTLQEGKNRHRFFRWTVRTYPVFLFSGIAWSAFTGNFDASLMAPGVVMLVLSAIIVFLLPYLLRLIYCTKIHASQPFFFGIEGYRDIYYLELLIFGSFEGRLQWSTAGSPLSRHCLDEKGMKEDFSLDKDSMDKQNMYTGLDPVKADRGIEALVEKAKASSHRDKKIFTLVDTYTMTVTLFEAVRPPVAVVMCGTEGGMQRALLCSEDWTTGTLYRETVLRVETRV